MLDDRAGRPGVAEFGDELERAIGIVEVVVAEFLALHLPCRGHPGCAGLWQVERRLLMRVLAISQCIGTGQRQRQHGWELLALVGKGEPACYGGIVGGGMRERRCR